MKELFNKPKLVGIVADINSGKSNLIYHIIETLRKDADFNLYTYGLKFPHGKSIFSLEELEVITNSIIIIDEAMTLFKLSNAKNKETIENTLRLLHHNNNLILLSILPENGRKFIASKLDMVIFKKTTLADCINGSVLKRIVTKYCGPEKGSTVLNIPINKCLLYNGNSYNIMDVPYYKEYDSKLSNTPILKKKELFQRKAS